MSNNGFTNEDNIKDCLNDKKINQLNKILKKFIVDIFDIKEKDFNNKIICEKIGSQKKGDLVITLNNTSEIISIKVGTGNSVHQEPVEDFIKYLKKEFGITKKVSDNLRLFIWGDKTKDGKGKVSDRLSASQFKKLHPEIVGSIQNYFDQHLNELIDRFVIAGKDSVSSADYLYYGDCDNGTWISRETMLDYLLNPENKTNGSISVGGLTFQAWNRNINGGDKSEHKRGVIQLKWGNVGNRIFNIN